METVNVQKSTATLQAPRDFSSEQGHFCQATDSLGRRYQTYKHTGRGCRMHTQPTFIDGVLDFKGTVCNAISFCHYNTSHMSNQT